MLPRLFDELESLSSHAKGRAFEQLVAWYLRNAPEYRALFEDVWLWRDWPGRWGADAGIDIVAHTFSGQLWAVQAKAYDPDHVIRRSDIDSFLVESSREVFAFRLLVASTDLLSRTAARTVHDQSAPVGLKLRSQLLAEDLAWPETLDGLEADAAAVRKRPESHQHEAIASVVSGLAEGGRGQLLMACGTGKTLTGMWVDEALQARRSLVLVPTLSLLGQTLRAWAAESAERFNYLAVCSDASVAPREDAFISHASDLGIPATTDAGEVARFLGPGDDKRVIFATYQSSRVVADAQLDASAGSLDLVIADEAHRCAGAGDGPFATVLSDDKIKARRRLFMTATPRYVAARAKAAADEQDFPVASMDDAAIFGPVLHRLSFADAIERGLLADYQVVVIGVGGDKTYSDYVAERALVTRDGGDVADAATLAAQIGLLKAMVRFDLCRVLSFHSRVAAASAFVADLPDVARWLPENDRPTGDLWARHVDGTMSAGIRDHELLRLRNASPEARGVLANVRCLGEGVDVPSIDAVAFMEPRSSVVDIIQAVGRAIRRADAKGEGTIIVPVFVREGEDTEHALASSTFKPVWDVVRALRAHDEQLAEILDASRRRVGRSGVTPEIPPKVKVIDIPATVGAEFAEAFAARLVETTTSSWEYGFGVLQRYVAREGSAATITKSEVVDGYALGQWVAMQRARWRHHRWPLPPERRKRLEEVPGWRWNKHELSWERGVHALESYVAEHGHARVPAEYVNEDGVALGYWVKRQRGKRAGTREGRLTQEQVGFLNAVPGWVWDARTAQWEDGYAALTEFVLREGHANPGHNHLEGDFRLGGWVRRQRDSRYPRGARTALDPARQRRLEALPGWRWTSELSDRSASGPVLRSSARTDERRWDRHDLAWERGLTALRTYAERVGHARVPSDYTSEDRFALGQWVKRQRGKHAGAGKGRPLTMEQERALEELPGWAWDAQEAKWEDGFSALVQYADREGHACPPHDHMEDGFPLGSWTRRQRLDRMPRGKRTGMSVERQLRLEAVPGWQWRLPVGWNPGFGATNRSPAMGGTSVPGPS